ncbi:MAG: transposase [Proteobacteria bacterium]|nr:transposase [Pseudomonadota bacterium]
MGGVDLSDNFLSHYQTLKSIKWYRKLLLHLINMATLNAYILNRKYGNNKLSHTAYRERIASYLITTSVETATCLKKKPSIDLDNTQLRLSGKHYIKNWSAVPSSKRKSPARKCAVCNFTPQQLAKYGYNDLKIPVKYSSYGCTICSQITLCITPCFEMFHSNLNYRQLALEYRIREIL